MKGKRCANRVAGGARNKLCGGCVTGALDSEACPSSPTKTRERKQSQADRRKPAHSEACASSPTKPRERTQSQADRRKPAHSEANPTLSKRPRVAIEPRTAGIAPTKPNPGPSKERRAPSEPPTATFNPVDLHESLVRRLDGCGLTGVFLRLMKVYLAELTEKAQATLAEEELWHFGHQFAIFCGRFGAKAGCPVDEFLRNHKVTLRQFVAALGHLSAAFVADPVDGTAESSSKAAESFKAWCLTALSCDKRKVTKVACWILTVAAGSASPSAEAGAASSA